MQKRGLIGGLALAAVLLSGCQSLPDWGGDPLRSEPVVKSVHEPDCEGDSCANVNAAYLRFPESPQLSAELERRLFALASGLSDSPDGNAMGQATSFDMFADQVFAASRSARRSVPEMPGFEADLKAEEVADHDDLLVIELDGYLYSGGAHGLPLTSYMVIERGTQQVVELADMLLPGQRPAYETALKRAHQRWLQTDQASGLSEMQWPFAVSDNVAPLEDGLAVKYQVYDLAPYATGQPQLMIPYAELDGILKARYLP
ncbi:RsiV family protein [Salinicola halimionae]|uniref:RsiV family protein n=1 Tax=Salinicola halimionae TaxID=1949081 RepID=UPI000DA16757|nr:RsiV family protein [Salinicola halimionae]